MLASYYCIRQVWRPMIHLIFVCGHTTRVSDTANASPRCTDCGCIQVSRVIPSRLPRFTGTVTGPVSDYKALEPGTVNVAPAGSLNIKERSK